MRPALRLLKFFLLAACIPALSGCLAKAAYDVATAPVRIAGKAIDLATTSQSEADEKRGRELRRREEQLGELDRKYRRARDDCEDGDARACEHAERFYEEIEMLLPRVPARR